MSDPASPNPKPSAVRDFRSEIREQRVRASLVKEQRKSQASPGLHGSLPNPQELARWHPSVLLDLAYNEYCCRIEAGESVDLDEFCSRYGPIATSLRRQIRVHHLLEARLLAEPGWPVEGETFLGLELGVELGRGTFARVFLAEEPELGHREVAVKFTPYGSREARVLGQFKHPNIVEVYWVEDDPASGLTGICMPYVGCATVLNLIESAFPTGTLPAAELPRGTLLAAARRINVAGESTPADPILERGTYFDSIAWLGMQIATGLSAAHTKGILHLDVKPSNILIDSTGCPKLLDFNLAQHCDDWVDRVGGTLAYMAPEQLAAFAAPDDAPRPDVRADIYSLGVTLYELLTGLHPLEPLPDNQAPKQAAAALQTLQSQGHVAIRSVNPRLDRGLAAIVERCLEIDPDRRWQTAAELAAALKGHLAPQRRGQRWVHRHPGIAAAVVSTVLGFVSIGVWEWSQLQPPAVRAYHQALRAYAAGDRTGSRELLDRSSDLDPYAVSPRLSRARLAQEDHRWNDAQYDLQRATELAPKDGRIHAALGYAFAMGSGQPASAVLEYQRAIDLGGESPIIWNNMGQAMQRSAGRAQAQQTLRRAVELEPQLQPAWHTLASVMLNQASQEKRLKADKLMLESLDCLKHAAAVGPTSARLEHDLAQLILYTNAQIPERDERVLKHLVRALELGLHPKELDDQSFRELRGNPEFERLRNLPEPATPAVPEVRHPDPITINGIDWDTAVLSTLRNMQMTSALAR